MTQTSHGSIRARHMLLLSFAALFTILPALCAAAELTPGRHTLRGESIRICNAIGEATIVPGEGSDVVVEVTPRGADAGRLRVVIDECKGAKRLRVVYPSNRIVDPTMGPDERRETTLDGCCGPDRIRFTQPGGGLDARADLTIRVPRDQKLGLSLGTGRIDATGVRGALALETGSGDIHVRNGVGSLSVDAGSGEVSVEKSRGSIAIDAGSGAVRIDEFDGTLAVDAGSGGVTVANLRTDRVAIDSGSGAVTGDKVVAGILVVDSGSGGIDFTRLTAPEIVFDTGSGGVSAGLEQSPKTLRIDSGSGSVNLTAPRDLDAKLRISCSKRRLDLGFPVVASRSSDDYFEGTAGSGRGLIVIESGSGRVSLQAEAE